MTNKLARVPVFFGEVKAELLKTSWPNRRELIGAAGVMLVITAIFTLYIGILDLVLSKVVSLLLR